VCCYQRLPKIEAMRVALKCVFCEVSEWCAVCTVVVQPGPGGGRVNQGCTCLLFLKEGQSSKHWSEVPEVQKVFEN
jgi:hypothetical protein